MRTIPTKEVLLQMVSIGKSTRKISEEFGVSYQTVKKWFDQNGIRFSYFIDAPPAHELIDLMKRFNAIEIADLYGIEKVYTVQSWFKMYGLKEYTKRERKQRLPEECREKVMNDYFLGLIDEADICDMYGLPLKAVEAEITEFGLSEDMVYLMPDRAEFKQEAEEKTLYELAEWYGTSETQILRWYKSLGVKQGDLGL
ncbi:helix-turn-helix domain-containing protein [Staphylococcus aureus]|uniref:helix-turn-helix domain-containing protein n=1 Tax=Staphylococcus aureus TaxID=1280 RepID=UPI0020C0E495|nr:helix-turn-helix domain-containing protein [Staphylococcus aureus]